MRRSRRYSSIPVVLAIPISFVLGLSAAQAAENMPAQQGWWTIGAAEVVGSDVPEKGLMAQGGSSAPVAYGALVYRFDERAIARTLNLTVAPNTATSPISALQVCQLIDQSITAAEGGAMTDAPKYDCTVKASGVRVGNSFRFDVAPFRSGGVLAIAVLTLERSDRVVLGPPGGDSLEVDFAATTPHSSARPATPAATVAGEPTSAGSRPETGFAPSESRSATETAAAPFDQAVADPPVSSQELESHSVDTIAGVLPTLPIARTDAASAAAVMAILSALLVGGGAWLLVGEAAVRSVRLGDSPTAGP